MLLSHVGGACSGAGIVALMAEAFFLEELGLGTALILNVNCLVG